jgi:Enoyl-CoA hydratase/carnithine racemase
MSVDTSTSVPVVVLEVQDGVAVVTLNRPEARNALDLPMSQELGRTFEEIASSSDVRAVVIRGAGPTFCAGADLKERRDKDAEWVRRRRLASFAAYQAIVDCPQPVITMVHGTVVGSGGEIAMAGDFIYAGDSTTFRFPEAHWGTIGATQRLQRTIGVGKAKELLFTNGVLPAEQALSLGLVQAVFPDQELQTRTMHAAETIAGAPGRAIQLTKKAIDDGSKVSLAEGISIEMACIEENLRGSQWQEGLKRFEAAHAKHEHGDGGHLRAPDRRGNNS